MNVRHPWWFAAVVLCSVTLGSVSGCGDDDDSSNTGGSGSGGSSSAGKGGAGGSAGKGGAGGSSSAPKAGSGGKSGAGGTVAALTCGGSACVVNSTLKMINAAAMACCTSDDKCGEYNSAMTCVQQNSPGELDTSCPDVHVMLNGMDYPQMGCCTPKGKCGGKFDQVGYGCIAREDLQSDMGGPLEAKTCGKGGEEGDAGAPDAG